MNPPTLELSAHKGDAGRVLLIAGSRTMPGAAVLAGRGALRAGAGLVTIACQAPEMMASLPAALPEAIYLELGAKELGAQLAERSDDAIVCGPGLGVTASVRALVEELLESYEGSVVLDADALNVIGQEPERLADSRAQLVLTPHLGEASRLLGRRLSSEPAERRDAALDLARRAEAIVCLKGAGTVVTDGERVEVNETGNAGMATAGSGDVLAGICAAYLAASSIAGSEDFDALRAARAAVYVHGLAGDLAAGALGERAVMASDLVDSLADAQIAHHAAASAAGAER
jgi:ADP-dependent NAD(P)H-hydrate dehydratase